MASPTPTRIAERRGSSSLSWLVLFAALAVALVSLLSTDFYVRLTGLLVVALGGVAACLFAWRDAQRAIRAAQQLQLADLRRHSEHLHAERSQHRRVLGALSPRIAGLQARERVLAGENARLQQTISTLRANYGAIQSRFESTINNLQTTSENVAAARSRIQDADFAQETAALSRAQILQQAGTAMVAQANQLPQGVLALLR